MLLARGLIAALVLLAPLVRAQPAPPSLLKSEHFDRDPGWEGQNNRLLPKELPLVTQDFGYSPRTQFAGREAGEIGGTVSRASVPAWFAARLGPKTLKDKLSASGSFAFTASSGSCGLFFGWFNANQPGGSRPINSLGLNFDAEGSGVRLAVRLISGSNRSCGTFITPFIPGKYRPTPIRNDGTRYTWTLRYDPAGNGGQGRFEFSLRSNRQTHEEFEDKVFTVDVPEAFRNQEVVFDRFGLMNMQRPGNRLTVYFDDLQFDGQREEFSKEPNWEGSGNRTTYHAQDVGGAHNFGYSAQTRLAGGAPGEAGGVCWRTDKNFGYYADRVGPFTLGHRLEARGKVMLAVGAPDSGACIGWFNRATTSQPMNTTNFLGVVITGPTRVGHYFAPAYATATGRKAAAQTGPVLVPGKPLDWKFVYDPAGNNGQGSVRVTLAGETVTLDLKPGHKTEGAGFDRFGLLSMRPGGSMVKIYFDDLEYTARP